MGQVAVHESTCKYSRDGDGGEALFGLASVTHEDHDLKQRLPEVFDRLKAWRTRSTVTMNRHWFPESRCARRCSRRASQRRFDRRHDVLATRPVMRTATLVAESASRSSRTLQIHSLHTTGNLFVYIEPVADNDPAQGVGDISFVLEDGGPTSTDADPGTPSHSPTLSQSCTASSTCPGALPARGS